MDGLAMARMLLHPLRNCHTRHIATHRQYYLGQHIAALSQYIAAQNQHITAHGQYIAAQCQRMAEQCAVQGQHVALHGPAYWHTRPRHCCIELVHCCRGPMYCTGPIELGLRSTWQAYAWPAQADQAWQLSALKLGCKNILISFTFCANALWR